MYAQQNPHPHFRHYGTEHGLPSPEVYCAFEDSRGYMWFGTDNGASRFNGYTFKNYGPQEGLRSNVVFDIKEDGKGRIWFGTMSGRIYLLEGDTIVPYKYNDVIEAFRNRFDAAGLLHVSEEGSAWVQLNRFGLLHITPQGAIDTITGSTPYSTLAIYIKEAQKAEIIPSSLVYLGKDSIDKLNEARRKLYQHYWEFFSEESSFIKVLPSSYPDYETPAGPGGWENVMRLPSGEWIVISDWNLHCIQDTQIIWTIPYDADITEIISEKNSSLWFCTVKGGGLRRYDDLEALKSNQYDSFP